jgi:hypothetical protein
VADNRHINMTCTKVLGGLVGAAALSRACAVGRYRRFVKVSF